MATPLVLLSLAPSLAGRDGLVASNVHLRDFARVLSGFDACASLEASAALKDALAKDFRNEEVRLWRAPFKSVWRSLRVGAPCPETAKWWVNASGDAVKWAARPMWAHCCNKGPSISRCPGQLLEAPSRCDGDRRVALIGECESDATLLCEPYFRRPQGALPGLVYSFGIASQWTFEDWAGSKGFEVHAFDPTTQFRSAHESHSAQNVHFHYMGLGARRGKAETWSHHVYGTLGGEVLPLDELVARLGHSSRPIQLLKIDCEGCEWEAFVDVATRAPAVIENVCTIILELHVSRTLQMNTTVDVKRMAAFWQLFVVKAGFRFWYMHPNPGDIRDRAVQHHLRALDLDPNTCCYEVGLHREVPECQGLMLR